MDNSTAIQIIDAISEKLGIAIDYTSDNVIPYVEDLLSRYARYITIYDTAIILIVFALLLIPLVPMMKQMKNKSHVNSCGDITPTFLILIIASVGFGLLFIFVLLTCVDEIIIANTIPEVLLLNLLK